MKVIFDIQSFLLSEQKESGRTQRKTVREKDVRTSKKRNSVF